MELLGWQKILVGAFAGYLLGSVPFAVVFSRLFKNADIRRVGTGTTIAETAPPTVDDSFTVAAFSGMAVQIAARLLF